MSIQSTIDAIKNSSSTSEIDHLYIGKIPAYNDKLTNIISYEERLKNNLTITTFSPTGYSINLFSADDDKTVGDNNTKKTIYKMGGNLSNTIKFDEGTITTTSALDNWLKMQKNLMTGNYADSSPFRNACKSFSIIATNDSTINETISNDYAPNKLGDVPSMLGSMLGQSSKDRLEALRNTAQFAASGMTSVDSMAMINMLQQKDSFQKDQSQIFSLLASQAIGIQSALPKIWQRSDYNNTSSFTIKLVSPSGHHEDVRKFVIDPLLRLILAASPITYDGVSYGYPPIWKVQARGLLSMNLAAITAIVISRGGQDTLFNRWNQPTNIDVRLTVEPLVNGFASPLTNDKTYMPTTDSGEVGMLLANPMAITDTMNDRSATTTKSFQLDTLVLGD